MKKAIALAAILLIAIAFSACTQTQQKQQEGQQSLQTQKNSVQQDFQQEAGGSQAKKPNAGISDAMALLDDSTDEFIATGSEADYESIDFGQE